MVGNIAVNKGRTVHTTVLADTTIRITDIDPMHPRDCVLSALEVLALSRVMTHRGSRWASIVYTHSLVESLNTGQAPTPADGAHLAEHLGFDPMEQIELEFYLHPRADGGITIAYAGEWEALFAEPVEKVLTGSAPGELDELWPASECEKVHVHVPGGMIPASCDVREAAVSALFAWYTVNDMVTKSQTPDTASLAMMRGRARRAVERNPDLVPPLESVLSGQWDGFSADQVLSAVEEA